MNAIELILGGARSGKSSYAERQAERQAEKRTAAESRDVIYIATAQAWDEEMKQRIQLHRQQRPENWHTYEEPLALAERLAKIQQQQPGAIILLDCLTLWVTNCLLENDGQHWPGRKRAFLQQLKNMSQPLILVSNEVGQGVVPLGELSRRFVDESGWLHQEIAALANDVTLVVAGIPMAVKRAGVNRDTFN